MAQSRAFQNARDKGEKRCDEWSSTRKAAWANPRLPATSPQSAQHRACAPWWWTWTRRATPPTTCSATPPTTWTTRSPACSSRPSRSSSAPRKPRTSCSPRLSPTCRSCSHPQLEELQGKLESRYKIFKLRDALDELADDFDAIFIDTPPALNFYTRSALIATQLCLIPFDCDDFSRRALYALMENVQEIRADHNRNLEVEGIVVNQFQPRASLPQKLVQELINEGLPVFKTYLSSSIRIRESHEQAKPMIHLDPKHKLAQEFTALHAELRQR